MSSGYPFSSLQHVYKMYAKTPESSCQG